MAHHTQNWRYIQKLDILEILTQYIYHEYECIFLSIKPANYLGQTQDYYI